MSDLNTVRVLSADLAVYVKESVNLLGTSFQVAYFPLVALGANGVIITKADGTLVDPLVNPYTVDTETGLVTFTSTAPTAQMLTVEYQHVSLTDATLQTLLALNVDSTDPPRLAAADALDIVASQQALIQKRITLLDLQTDGAAVAKALRDHAAVLRKLVFDPDFVESTFDFVEQVNLGDSPAWWEKVRKDWSREFP